MDNVTYRDRFRKPLLPPAEVFFRNNVEKFRARGRRAIGLCPFHKDKNPSLSMDLDRGLFNCFACGASGGDIVDFVMLRDKCDFKTAARRLGCWDDAPLRIDAVVIRRTGPPVPYLVLDFSIDGIEYHSEGLRDEPKTELQQTHRFYAEAKARLAEICSGDAEEFEGEEESQWGILAASWELIQMEVGR